MLATLITICINVLAFAVGVYIGSIIFGKDEPKLPTETQNPVKEYHPIVISIVFRKPLTKHMLVEEVLIPQCYKFMHHFDIPNPSEFSMSKEFKDAIDQKGDAIMQWYNPEYNELLLIAHQEPNDNGGFWLDWTWRKPSHGVVDELGR